MVVDAEKVLEDLLMIESDLIEPSHDAAKSQVEESTGNKNSFRTNIQEKKIIYGAMLLSTYGLWLLLGCDCGIRNRSGSIRRRWGRRMIDGTKLNWCYMDGERERGISIQENER